MKEFLTLHHSRLTKFILLGILIFSTNFQTHAQCNVEWAKHIAMDLGENFQFGRAIDVSGNYAVVGTHKDDEKGVDAGAAYIMERSGGTWSVIQKILADDGAPNHQFGFSVAISGETLMIGAPNRVSASPVSGSVYVFEKTANGWINTEVLTAVDALPGAQFGSDVHMEGEKAVIGAQLAHVFAGAAYVFKKGAVNWSQTAKLTASDGVFFSIDLFGASVHINGATIAVGAPFDDNSNDLDAGSVYVFEEVSPDLWTQTARLQASSGEFRDFLGVSVGISGNLIFCGAPLYDFGDSSDVGAVFLFEKSYGSFQQSDLLGSPNGYSADGFGISLAVSGSRLVIGAAGALVNGTRAGAAYTYHDDDGSWSQVDELSANDGGTADAFGTAVAISGIHALVGSPLHNQLDSINSGAVYSFDLNRAPKAQAGSDVTVFVSDPAILNGDGSVDGDGDPITYSWNLDSQPSGSSAALIDDASVSPSLVPDVAGIYTISLVVDDGCASSSAEHVTVTAITVADAIGELQDIIAALHDSGVLNNGQANSLTQKLNQVLSLYDDGKINTACNKLQSFINQVNAFVNGGILTTSEAQALLDLAGAIGEHLGCYNALIITEHAVIAANELGDIYPNPAAIGHVKIPMSLLEEGKVKLEIIDIHGRTVLPLVEGWMRSGRHLITVPIVQLDNGIYFYRMTFNEWTSTRTMTIQR